MDIDEIKNLEGIKMCIPYPTPPPKRNLDMKTYIALWCELLIAERKSETVSIESVLEDIKRELLEAYKVSPR